MTITNAIYSNGFPRQHFLLEESKAFLFTVKWNTTPVNKTMRSWMVDCFTHHKTETMLTRLASQKNWRHHVASRRNHLRFLWVDSSDLFHNLDYPFDIHFFSIRPLSQICQKNMLVWKQSEDPPSGDFRKFLRKFVDNDVLCSVFEMPIVSAIFLTANMRSSNMRLHTLPMFSSVIDVVHAWTQQLIFLRRSRFPLRLFSCQRGSPSVLISFKKKCLMVAWSPPF